MRTKTSRFIVITTFFVCASVFAQVPRTMNYQGKLTNPSGIAVSGDYNIDFRIYPAETGGSYSWHQTKTVTITNGLFEEQLDLSINGGDTLSFARPYWLALQIASDPEMTPREKLAPVAFAYRAVYSDTTSYVSGGMPEGTENQTIRRNASDWEATNSIVIESDGDVGIGTTTPVAKLDVVGNIQVNENGFLFTDPENSDALIGLRASDPIYSDEGISIRTGADSPAGEPIFRVISSGGSERLRVEHNGALRTSNYIEVDGMGDSYIAGNLAVGTTSSPGHNLDVVGYSYIGNTFVYSEGSIELGERGSGNREAYIDFHSDDTYTDYSLRLIREGTGENADSRIQHRGTGDLILNAIGNGNIHLNASGRVGIKTSTPDASAKVEISSTDGGLLIPRLTEAQRDAMDLTGSPNSVTIFNTTTKCFEFYYDGIWNEIGCVLGPCRGITSVVYGGQTYSTVEIGDQCWLKENLNVTNGNTDQSCSITRYCYSDNSANCTTYGGLYIWDDVMCGASECNGTDCSSASNAECSTPVQGICPDGWHIPSHHEWTVLENYVEVTWGSGSAEFPCDESSTLWQGTYAGGDLKEAGTTHWTSETCGDGTCNESGFTALGAGCYYEGGGSVYVSLTVQTYWWSSTESSSGTAVWARGLYHPVSDIYRYPLPKDDRYSVRCLKDN